MKFRVPWGGLAADGPITGPSDATPLGSAQKPLGLQASIAQHPTKASCSAKSVGALNEVRAAVKTKAMPLYPVDIHGAESARGKRSALVRQHTFAPPADVALALHPFAHTVGVTQTRVLTLGI